jgi:urease accessory protein
MAMDGRLAMSTDLLTLTQWLSPAFPTGAFSWSHGLEAFVAAGEVTDRVTFEAWLADVLRFGAGKGDAVILAATLGGADAGKMADLARAMATSAERLEETLAQGAAFARTLRALGHDLPDVAMPVVVGLAARGLVVAPQDVVALYLQGFATNLTQIGVRMALFGQSEGQMVLGGLTKLIRDLAAVAVATAPDTLTTFVPRADLMAMRHEGQETRLWRS